MTSEAILNLLFAAADDIGRTFDHRDLAERPPATCMCTYNYHV